MDYEVGDRMVVIHPVWNIIRCTTVTATYSSKYVVKDDKSDEIFEVPRD